MPDDLSLSVRDGLPDALCVLLREYPRDLWESHVRFDGLTRFWLERHMMFRRLLDGMTAQTQGLLDRRIAPERARHAAGRQAQMLLTQLHAHHKVEDMHYFPRLSALAPGLARGFDMLDHDHHVLDVCLHGLVDTTNRMLRAEPIRLHDRAGALNDDLVRFSLFLDRHLLDEEELVVPIILENGAVLDG
ncbi:hemerythrin HHE cation binding domain-containing protein [Rhodovulum bhavnagarense]|uniref:Hemerythrin HHE cation binding domain-containing protein n=1 Tax=Rhodovulum bhavnagarense TaxID=992286 RepID=A0A4R2RJN4_9RHOB|nr:hemerythrin domain-containing protein [Rhodovulum bhavnagarense]TCP62968.1 hemerythrin HHE cation binding domain-containing protein [Rhodovulum bhavnagarense]